MGLTFEVVSELEQNDDFVTRFLENRGVENPEIFLNPDDHLETFYTDPLSLYNITDAVKLLDKSIENNDLIGVLVDDDADGYSSASALIKFISLIRGNMNGIEWFFHANKSHGLIESTFRQILESDCDLVIIPDAASNDFDQQRQLLEKGKKVIILDHHEVDNQIKIKEIKEQWKNEYALVNNQLSFNSAANKNLVGAGVVFKFIEAYDLINQTSFAKEVMDLIAIGQIGDSSDISDYEIRWIIKNGLENIKSPILKIIFNEKIEKGTKIAPINLSFSIIPLINSVSRVGTLEDKDLVLKSLLGYWDENEKLIVPKRRKNKLTGKMDMVDLEMNMYQISLDTLEKIKAKQNRSIDAALKNIGDSLYKNTICISMVTEEEIKFRSVTGLIANKLSNTHKMPTLVLVENNDGTYSGSGRGFEKVITDFRQWCLKTGLFELAQGHNNAFGVVITKENLEKLKTNIEFLNGEALAEMVYEVDRIITNDTNLKEVKQMNDNQDIFGGKVSKPVFGYRDLIITRNSLNQRGSVVTFFHKGLEFIAYKQEAGIIDELIESLGFQQEVMVDLIGSPSRNEWNGRVKEQIVLEDYFITKDFIIEESDQYLDSSGALVF